MISLKNIKNQKLNDIRLVDLLFCTLPISFIIGNLIISAHLLLFILVSLYVIKKEKFKYQFKNSHWLLIAFFLYFFLSTTIQFQSPGLLNEKIEGWSLENNPTFKSLMMFRFIILILVIDVLLTRKILDLKKLFLVSLLCTSFVSFDVILQYIAGQDIFGYKSLELKNSGPFGDELIAGSYLEKFSFLSFFYIITTYKNKNFKNPLIVFLIISHAIAILLAGNRMPMILFLFGCSLIILFIKNLRFLMSLSLVIFAACFLLIVNNDTNYKYAYAVVLSDLDIKKLIKVDKNDAQTEKRDIADTSEALEEVHEPYFLQYSGYNRLYRTSIKIWKEQPLFGFGLKSFRIMCWEILAKEQSTLFDPYPELLACSTHPHNYYFELLAEAGIIGTFLMIVFFFILIKNSFHQIKKLNRGINSETYLLIPIIIAILLEIWPLRSAGSFFTTATVSYFWLNVAILMSAKRKI